MRITQAVSGTQGVSAAQVGMATELNVELAVALNFSVPTGIVPNDLLVAVRGADQRSVDAGLAAVDLALTAATDAGRTGAGFGNAPPPRTVRSAAQLAPDAALVLLSVPGPAVLGEAMDAIESGRHVMIFSDNVPVEHEIALKDAAAKAGVMVMGPDCGTAVIGGVGLGFANVLSHSAAAGTRVGVIAASGTGAQQLTCLLDEAGVAISQVIGLGGRDLSERVGGRSALAALELLERDPNTGHIVLISKPPHLATGKRVTEAALTLATPVTPILLGPGQPDISSAAERVLATLGIRVPEWPCWSPPKPLPSNGSGDHGGALRGLFSGGTLADEAMLVIQEALGTGIRSNIPLRPELGLPAEALGQVLPKLAGLGTVIVDLGDDRFTSGRPHPMIDPTLKLELLADQADDPQVRVVLLDVVLGFCAEADPAALLAPAIQQVLAVANTADRPLDVVVSLCGSAGDPQDRDRQAAELVAAGAQVFLSNAAAARAAAAIAIGSAAIGSADPTPRER
ncbi:MAG: FdrA family protein [Actinomycetota bacterium]|nr:FdrA family protein [Actinomycetota bacterium]